MVEPHYPYHFSLFLLTFSNFIISAFDDPDHIVDLYPQQLYTMFGCCFLFILNILTDGISLFVGIWLYMVLPYFVMGDNNDDLLRFVREELDVHPLSLISP